MIVKATKHPQQANEADLGVYVGFIDREYDGCYIARFREVQSGFTFRVGGGSRTQEQAKKAADKVARNIGLAYLWAPTRE